MLGCYSRVALGHGEDNANYLYLYLLSVGGKLLVNDSGSSEQTVYSAAASAVLSHTGALCPCSITALCYSEGTARTLQNHTVNNSVASGFLNSQINTIMCRTITKGKGHVYKQGRKTDAVEKGVRNLALAAAAT